MSFFFCNSLCGTLDGQKKRTERRRRRRRRRIWCQRIIRTRRTRKRGAADAEAAEGPPRRRILPFHDFDINQSIKLCRPFMPFSDRPLNWWHRSGWAPAASRLIQPRLVPPGSSVYVWTSLKLVPTSPLLSLTHTHTHTHRHRHRHA